MIPSFYLSPGEMGKKGISILFSPLSSSSSAATASTSFGHTRPQNPNKLLQNQIYIFVAHFLNVFFLYNVRT